MSTLVELNHVGVGYGRQAVLSGINLRLERGAFTGLLGANGSGKTTLLKTIARILPPLAGNIRFDSGAAVIGYVPQRESLDQTFLLSSIEVVLMGACGRVGPGRRLGRREHQFALDCMHRTGSDTFHKRAFAQLSGGQKQRVLIARALVARPDLLLLDEPTAGVDADATDGIVTVLRELNRDGMTILMVNHDLPVVRRSVRDVLWVRGGQIESGPVETMLNRVHLEAMLSE